MAYHLKIEILTDNNINIEQQAVKTNEPTLISIDFDLITKWMICRVVIFKYDVRHFTNDRGEYKIFSFNIQDNTGELNFLTDDDYGNCN
ncbi:unnamed protein product [Rotaria socialis]|uniref:Replication protein A1 n=1 Tax=Rotaria socialis TaxID=392032 RepID=A0A821I910_9BILA|nr:unnamed protein product [Rotaria socialis]